MFKMLSSALKEKDIRNKILFTLGVLIIFRLGTHITVPGVNAKAISEFSDSGIFSMLNTFGGGALSQYSIFAMGVSPYITSSIVVQLLQMDIVPKFVEWSKQGEVGRKKLNQVTRYLTIIMAFVQSIGISYGFNALSGMGLIKNPGASTYLSIALILTAGTMLVMWMGEQITVKGFGNGVSMIIFSGIVARVPADVMDYYNAQIRNAGPDLWKAILFTLALIVAIIAVVILVVYFETAKRKIKISYSKRAAASDQSTFLPLKINSAGVIPVIFASSFIVTPQTIMGFFRGTQGDTQWFQILSNVFDYQKPIGAALYTLLIVVFTFFYAFIQVNPEKVAENLQKQGGYIPSVRPGKGTEDYISSVLMRLSTVGAVYLGLIALLPIVAGILWNLPQSIGLGGTSLLIVVGVALESTRQLEGQMIKRSYLGFIQ
ncbi:MULTISPECIES: preprotein translocase subunit SecY [Carnobacterium]|jgi:preprotein translocase subunit SecY|uniref:Protein translocase subunit SecY n=2 Tax=Carnobacterium maltaromaticum TaxID=2751 RepID=K8E7E9_CARML|nr:MULTISPECIES: preprotein translocase subunit SecY [Carnobacterium]AOA03290.1 preprotein translocase subunit SecY [Carnobacterium maltaromaticum]KRN68293.1 preprotein translocase subunit SecY [Carnobacterium maltaromaticum DSM 20342]KRN71197.1 preprotein translocase subunit SecY [Carnobacterium maltaromaticum]KRN86568.1 preprotein translocase subunit SecY [Carnobacterium maltaromaticum]MBC9788863.1 preprotein translocase subunit SecY [Carnobacterium maltaromaticum]